MLHLGIARQAVLKLNSFISDMNDQLYEDGMTDNEKNDILTLRDMGVDMMNHLIHLSCQDITEDQFLGIQAIMDDVEIYGEDE